MIYDDIKEKYIVRNNNIPTSNMGGELAMMDVESGKYYVLNELGVLIWDKIEQPITIMDVVTKLLEEYDVEYNVCKNDVLEFINNLLQKKLIELKEI